MSSTTEQNDSALKAEIAQIKKEVPTIDDVKFISAVPALARVEIKYDIYLFFLFQIYINAANLRLESFFSYSFLFVYL